MLTSLAEEIEEVKFKMATSLLNFLFIEKLISIFGKIINKKDCSFKIS